MYIYKHIYHTSIYIMYQYAYVYITCLNFTYTHVRFLLSKIAIVIAGNKLEQKVTGQVRSPPCD